METAMNNGTSVPALEMILDRILLELDPPPTTIGKTKKIAMPEAYCTNSLVTRDGTVVARGPGRTADLTGVALPMLVEVGDRVKIGAQAGYNLSELGLYDDKEYRLINQQEIVAVISRTPRPAKKVDKANYVPAPIVPLGQQERED